MAEALKFQPLSIAIDDQNRECIHYARGCQSILRNYLSDADTSIEYSTDDQLGWNPDKIIWQIPDYLIKKKYLQEDFFDNFDTIVSLFYNIY